jgi:DNA repair protein RadC
MNIYSSDEIVQLMRRILPHDNTLKNTVWVIGVDGKHDVTFIERTQYSPEEFNLLIDTTLSHLYEPSKIAFIKGVRFMFLIHTHKAGDLMPSKDDCRFTNRQIKEGKILAIRVMDHIIIAGEEYYSMADNGTLGMTQIL